MSLNTHHSGFIGKISRFIQKIQSTDYQILRRSRITHYGYASRLSVCILACATALNAHAYTKTWTSSDDPTWYYTATLSNPLLKKVGSSQEGLPFNEGAVPVSTAHCTMGSSNLFAGNLFVWCFFNAGHSKVSYLDTKPYAHWFYLEEPSPFDPYWTGSRLSVWGNVLQYGPGFEPQDLPGTRWREGDHKGPYYRVWNNGTYWSGATVASQTGQMIYLSLDKIEKDMFGKKMRSQNILRQRIQMTDPVKVSDVCCDNGIYEQSFSYDITLQRYPLLVTLPSHVDMGEVAVGADSEPHVIPVSVSSNKQPVEIVQGIANISFEQIKKLTPDTGSSTCDAALLVYKEGGQQVNAGSQVDLYSFRNGISTKIVNTDGCETGSYNGTLAFTVSWK